jgi:hypothetical protein
MGSSRQSAAGRTNFTSLPKGRFSRFVDLDDLDLDDSKQADNFLSQPSLVKVLKVLHD